MYNLSRNNFSNITAVFIKDCGFVYFKINEEIITYFCKDANDDDDIDKFYENYPDFAEALEDSDLLPEYDDRMIYFMEGMERDQTIEALESFGIQIQKKEEKCYF
jgi:hypothetical protein